jgi:hypothetical protein
MKPPSPEGEGDARGVTGEIVRGGEGESQGEGDSTLSVNSPKAAHLEASSEEHPKATTSAESHGAAVQKADENVENIVRGMPNSPDPRLRWLSGQVREFASKMSPSNGEDVLRRGSDMQTMLLTADGKTTVKTLELPAPADVVVWEQGAEKRYFVRHGDCPDAYREAIVVFVNSTAKAEGA